MQGNFNTEYHIPALLNECLENLRISQHGDFVDCTLGGGGHSAAIANLMSEGQKLHCFDRDPEAILEAKKKLAEFGDKIIFHNKPFSCLGEEITSRSLGGILYDLGVSSHQIDTGRGFSFVGAGALDMRMNASEGDSAQDYLRAVSQDELANAFRKNSDLDRAGRLAGRILGKGPEDVFLRGKNDVWMAADLNAAVEEVYFNRKEDWNSLKARVFQAIRMEVNSEIAEIKKSLSSAVELLLKGGRLCIITYHSKEAQAVKETLSHFEKDCICPHELPVCVCGGKNKKIKRAVKKPIFPTAEEIKKNPRARSAALRVYERV